MKRKIFNIALLVLFLAGAGVLLYPAASNWWNQMQQNKIADGYAETVDSTSEEEIKQMWEEAQAYNKNLLLDEIIIDPFDQVENRKVDGDYENTLNPQNNGVMGTVEIPKINVHLPIYHGTSEEVLQKAVGHLEQTSLPIGGEGTHAVLSGHRGLPSAELFTNLDKMEEGDVFYLHILEETLAYQVDKITVVEPDNLQDLAIEAGKDYVTLVTCTPYSINSHRLLVRGERIPYEEEEKKTASEKAEDTFDVGPYLILIPLLLLVIAGAAAVYYRNKKKKRTVRSRQPVKRKHTDRHSSQRQSETKRVQGSRKRRSRGRKR